FAHAVLLAAGLDDCVHDLFSFGVLRRGCRSRRGTERRVGGGEVYRWRFAPQGVFGRVGRKGAKVAGIGETKRKSPVFSRAKDPKKRSPRRSRGRSAAGTAAIGGQRRHAMADRFERGGGG